jgi:LPS O-antigen subunit length determinant protein (WzzB/FepE family)
MIKLLEAIFCHFIRLLLILFIPIMSGLGIGFLLPPSYQASATLWAVQRYPTTDMTGVDSNLQASPADTQVNALTELLQSRTFDSAVGTSTNLKSMLKLSSQDAASPPALDDAYLADISKNVRVISKGNNLYQISYTSGNPRIASQVAQAIITQFQAQIQQFITIKSQSLLQGNLSQLAKAEHDANTTANNESAYLAAHRDATLRDLHYALLDALRVQAQSTLTNLQSTIATLNREAATAQSTDFFKILDSPVTPEVPLHAKSLLAAGGAGAAIGLVVCIIYILILVRRDRALYTTLDAKKVTSYTILMQIPHLPKATSAFPIVTPDIAKNSVIDLQPVKQHKVMKR